MVSTSLSHDRIRILLSYHGLSQEFLFIIVTTIENDYYRQLIRGSSQRIKVLYATNTRNYTKNTPAVLSVNQQVIFVSQKCSIGRSIILDRNTICDIIILS